MNKGFTLVEVLVVAVIVALLSAVAIPAMNGYIERTSDMVCEHTAASVLKSIVVYIQDRGWNASMIGSYDINSINTLLGEFKVKIEDKYTVDINIDGPDRITVFVQDDQYMGTATIGT